MEAYQESMLSANTTAYIRSRISDFHTLNVSSYDPALIEVLDT